MQSIPLDMVKKILFLLSPEDLQEECRSNKYISDICRDDNFFFEYINKNFDPQKFNIYKWSSSVFHNKNFNYYEDIDTWKKLLNKLISKNNIRVELIDATSLKTPKENTYIEIYFYDSIIDIIERIKKLFIHNNYELNYIGIRIYDSTMYIENDEVESYSFFSQPEYFTKSDLNKSIGNIKIDNHNLFRYLNHITVSRIPLIK